MPAPTPPAESPVPEAAEPFTFAVAGRLYEAAGAEHLTFRRSLHINAVCARGGIHELMADVGAAFAPQAMAAVAQLYERGALFDLLGAMTHPVGVAWSPEQAEETARVFADATDPAEHEVLTTVLMQALTGFFVNRAASPTTSPSSSSPEAAAPSAPVASDPTSATGPDSAASRPTATGTRRSASSRKTTRSGSS